MMGRDRMRAVNAVFSAAMMVLFLIHAVGNSFQMLGVGTPLSKALSWALVALCVIHATIGVALTADTLRAQREAGVSYPRSNVRFWTVRVSGMALALLMLAHVLVFLKPAGEAVRLPVFQRPQLVLSVLLVVALALHVLANMQPMLISLGLPSPAERAEDLALVTAALLVLMTVAFIVYYLRWSVI